MTITIKRDIDPIDNPSAEAIKAGLVSTCIITVIFTNTGRFTLLPTFCAA